MNNEMSVRLGNVICIAIWIIEGIASIVFALKNPKMSDYSALIIFGAMVAGLLILVWNSKRSKKSTAVFFPFVVFSTVMAYFIAIVAGGAFLMCMLYIMQWLLLLFYLDKFFCYELGAFQVFILFALYIPGFIDATKFSLVDRNQLMLAIVSMAICTWIAINLVGIFKNQLKMSIEQKQSLDDMLKVVETLCEESKQSTDEKSESIIKLSRMFNSSTKAMSSMIAQAKNEKDIDRLAEYIGKIGEAGETLRYITQEVMVYNRLGQKELFFYEKRYSLGEVLEKVIRNQLPKLKEKHNDLKINVATNVPDTLIGDAKYIEMLINLIVSNAVKYTDRGVIYINVFLSKNIPGHNKCRLRLDVTDTGRGIRSKDKENIFIPFYRVEENNSDEENGVGLGLYIARELAGLMGGDILVSSDYGKGSSFYIEILQGIDISSKEHDSLYDHVEGMLSMILMEENDAQTPTSKVLKNAALEVAKTDDLRGNASSNSVSDMFPAINGVDWSVALSFLPSRAIILATLGELVKSGYDNADELRRLYQACQDNFEEVAPDFKIKVHAIKSNLKMIGAVELSDRAKDLEYASRDLDRDFVFANTESFINDYIELIITVSKIPELAQKKSIIKQSADPKVIMDKLHGLIVAMEEFDTDKADALIAEIEGFDYDEKIAGTIKEISSMVLKLDLDGVKSKVTLVEEEINGNNVL